MSLISLRFTPPDRTYDGFKFRMASTLCVVFGFFSLLFFLKHVLIFDRMPPRRSPEALHVGWNYLQAYYWKTLNGGTEFALVLIGFAAVFWLNIPKQYFADRYRDYGKEKSSPEAKSLTLLLTLSALSLVLLAVPLLSLHFPVWLSYVAKYGPIAAGILQYLSILPDLNHVERFAAIDKLGWDGRCFDDGYRSPPGKALQGELDACLSLATAPSPDAARRFLTQGSVSVAWSGVDALFNNLETFLGVSAEGMSLHNNGSKAIEFALGELLDARGASPAVILTTDAEAAPLLPLLRDCLKSVYPFRLHTVPVQDALWKGSTSNEIVATLLKNCVDNKPDIAVLSHVFPDTGVVLDVKQLIEAVRKEGLRTVFVIDGSQAIGNIDVDDEVLARSAFYIFEGHRWLLGPPSVGVLVRNGWLLNVAAGAPRQNPAARRFSRSATAKQEDAPLRCDGFVPWFALNYVLKHEWLAVGAGMAAKHSEKLAGLFRDEMRKRDIRTIGVAGRSSAVVIADVSGIEALQQALAAKQVQCSLVGATLDPGGRTVGIRFCFHHYHSDDDVRDLAEFIGNAGIEAYARASTEPLEAPAARLSARA